VAADKFEARRSAWQVWPATSAKPATIMEAS
jgi:hypothetical protein